MPFLVWSGFHDDGSFTSNPDDGEALRTRIDVMKRVKIPERRCHFESGAVSRQQFLVEPSRAEPNGTERSPIYSKRLILVQTQTLLACVRVHTRVLCLSCVLVFTSTRMGCIQVTKALLAAVGSDEFLLIKSGLIMFNKLIEVRILNLVFIKKKRRIALLSCN